MKIEQQLEDDYLTGKYILPSHLYNKEYQDTLKSINEIYNKVTNLRNRIYNIQIPFFPDSIHLKVIEDVKNEYNKMLSEYDPINKTLAGWIFNHDHIVKSKHPYDLLAFHSYLHMQMNLLNGLFNSLASQIMEKEHAYNYHFALKYSIAGTAIGIVSIIISILTFFLTR